MHEGQLIVNRDSAAALARVFRRLYRLQFPIRHMRLGDIYGPRRAIPRDQDVTASFQCRQSVPSPCTGGTASGRWSNHAYGLAIDLNPLENPYVSGGRTSHRRSVPYLERSPYRKGMIVEGGVVTRAFDARGWGWGGRWSGTIDYQHLSVNGR